MGTEKREKESVLLNFEMSIKLYKGCGNDKTLFAEIAKGSGKITINGEIAGKMDLKGGNVYKGEERVGDVASTGIVSNKAGDRLGEIERNGRVVKGEQGFGEIRANDFLYLNDERWGEVETSPDMKITVPANAQTAGAVLVFFHPEWDISA